MKRLLFVLALLVVMPISAQDDSRLRAAEDLLAASQAEQTFDTLYSQFGSSFGNMAKELGMAEEQNALLDKYQARMIDLLKEEMSWAKMGPRMAELYAEVYSEQELVELTEFYLSPIGKKFVSRTPELMQASMQMSQDMLRGALPKIQELQKELQNELTRPKPEGQ